MDGIFLQGRNLKADLHKRQKMIREILNTEIKSIENDGIDVLLLTEYKVKNVLEVPFSISNFSVL